MSLVVAEFTQDYIVFGCDQRKRNGDKITSEEYRKIFKINDNCIIGFAGNIRDLTLIIGSVVKFSNLSEGENATISQDVAVKSYTEINSIVSHSYNEVKKCFDKYGKDDEFNKEMFAFVLLGGVEEYIVKLNYYALLDGKAIDIHYTFPPKEYQNVCINGNHIHTENFQINSSKYPKHTIRNFKNAFHDTVDQGIKFDDTINNKCLFETIRIKRKD